MKILCLIDSLGSGGAERQMSYLATGLKKAGCDVTLVVFSSNNNFYGDYVAAGGVNLIFDDKGANRYRRILRIRKWVNSFRPDAVIAYKDGVTMAACLARYLKSFNLIVSERNTTQVLSRYERLKFFLYRKANHIVPNSFSQAQFIERNYPRLSAKTTVITNALDTSAFVVPEDRAQRKPLVFVTTARVMAQKNVLRFLDAISLLKKRNGEVVFRWFGTQSDPYFNEVREKVKSLGLEEMIEFHQPVKDVVREYAAADFFCLPSVYEGFPNVVCEAMNSGLPVVCGRVCDNPYIVEEGVNGFLFNPLDAYDMAAKIEAMIDMERQERLDMGKRNVGKIKDLCSFDSFIKKYVGLIDKR